MFNLHSKKNNEMTLMINEVHDGLISILKKITMSNLYITYIIQNPYAVFGFLLTFMIQNMIRLIIKDLNCLSFISKNKNYIFPKK